MNLTKTITNQPKSQVDIQITIPWSDLESKWNETSAKLASEVEIPGFRKGAAPADMVEPRIAAQLQQDFLQAVMPAALMEALQDTQVVPIDYPQYQVTSFSKGNPIRSLSANLPPAWVSSRSSNKTSIPSVNI